MQRETGSQKVVTEEGREGVLVERAASEVKVRWEDGTEEWVPLADVREQASSDLPERELGS